eukprot:1317843-Prymnesium_polylepis.1
MLSRLSTILPGFGDVVALASGAVPNAEILKAHALFLDSPQACFPWLTTKRTSRARSTPSSSS